jgi:HEAT repeat protein
MKIFSRKTKDQKMGVSVETNDKTKHAKLDSNELHTLIEQEIRKLRDDDEEIKEGAKKTLVEIGTDAVEPLILALKDEDSVGSAAEVLGDIGDGRAQQPLLEIMHGEGWERFSAAVGLTKLGDDRGLAFLDVCIHPDPTFDNFLFRRFAALSLGQIDKGFKENKRAIEILRNAYQTEEEAFVRRDIVQSLGTIGNSSVKSTLNEALKDEDEEVKQAAKQALAKL